MRVKHKCANCGHRYDVGPNFICGLVECPKCGLYDYVLAHIAWKEGKVMLDRKRKFR